MNESNQTILHLSLIDTVGPATIQIIREHKPHDMQWSDLYRLSIAEWCQYFDLRQPIAHNLFYGLADKTVLEHERAQIERISCHVVTILDPSYPEQLKHINAPPPVLYVQGASLETFTKCLAIIGSRDADRYGKQVIESLVPPLVEHGWSVVSGGALGADAMAHAATLKAGGKTIAILGSGLLHPLPTSNLKLFDAILAQEGALLSIFPMNEKARPEHFPIRNRIISGISRGVIVAQAARKSGTRITAQYALEQGRDVFAVPGPIDHPLSEGCHALIQEGAKLISCVADVLEEYGEEQQDTQLEIGKDEQFEPLKKQKKIQKNEDFKPRSIISSVRPACPEDSRGKGLEGQGFIISLCKNPISLDDLISQTQLPLGELQKSLFDLQMEGMIQQNFAGLWERV